MSDESIEIKVNDSSHPYDDPLWYRKMLDWDEKTKKELAIRTASQIKDAGDTLYFVGIVPKIVYLMIDGDEDENSYLWVHKFSMATVAAWKETPKKLHSLLKYNPRQYLDWFERMQDLDRDARIKVKDKIVESLKTKNPAFHKGIKSGDLVLIGFTPRLDFFSVGGPVSNKRCFAIPTLLFWSKVHSLLAIVNMEITEPITVANRVLRYNDTVLNDLNSKKENIRGITG